MEDLKVIQIKDTTQTTTLIRVGEASGDLPRHLMSGEKECGYLVQGRKIEPWYWNSIKDKEGFRTHRTRLFAAASVHRNQSVATEGCTCPSHRIGPGLHAAPFGISPSIGGNGGDMASVLPLRRRGAHSS